MTPMLKEHIEFALAHAAKLREQAAPALALAKLIEDTVAQHEEQQTGAVVITQPGRRRSNKRVAQQRTAPVQKELSLDALKDILVHKKARIPEIAKIFGVSDYEVDQLIKSSGGQIILGNKRWITLKNDQVPHPVQEQPAPV